MSLCDVFLAIGRCLEDVVVSEPVHRSMKSWLLFRHDYKFGAVYVQDIFMVTQHAVAWPLVKSATSHDVNGTG
ncbi:hypothetical protein HS088_TW01G00307 [Tripterygium wilfordii]|uniref:Uncharacterized protein n=1 Tax=Tripterygium wilfordii TaxID=458696 RepID=A0A7J7E1B5_TRIWF|nr:hypothetical protein HS088_TW01G00307 [Tripterygium wilfordii]